MEAVTFAPTDETDDTEEVAAGLADDTHWYVRVAATCYRGAAKNDVAAALSTAPGRLPNNLRRLMMDVIPVSGWFPDRLVPHPEHGGDAKDAELAFLTLQILKQAVGREGADLDDDTGYLEIRRAVGLAQSLRLTDQLVRDAPEGAMIEFYVRFTGSLR